MNNQPPHQALPPGALYHVADVTNSFDHAVEVLRSRYHLGAFQRLGPMTRSFAPGGRTSLQVGLADAGPTQVEVIEPLTGFIDLYHRAPTEEPFSLHLHHLGFRVPDLVDLGRIGQELEASGYPVFMGGRVGEAAHFLYADTRATFGHYLEYVVPSRAEGQPPHAVRIVSE